MNSKEVKYMQKFMKDQFGTHLNGVFYRGSKDRVYLGTNETIKVNLRSFNAEGVGVYIGRLTDQGFRPSIEGAQLLRPKKNVFELTEAQLKDWLMGYTIELDTDYNGYCALSYKGEVVGPGKIANNKVWNYVPKERRIKKLIKP